MSSVVTMQSGIIIRDFLPEDRDAYISAFQRLSKRSLLHRFNMPIKRLTPGQLRYLTELDYEEHYACCAHEMREGQKHGIGLGRFVRTERDPGTAEFAVTVIDEYQRRGIGRALFEYLREKSREKGVVTLRGYIRYDNTPMLSLLSRYQRRISHGGGNLLRVDIG